MLEGINREAVVCIWGEILLRSADTINHQLATGQVELAAQGLNLLGKSYGALPFEIATSTATKEEMRLHYRYLDLRNKKVYDNVILRS